MMCDMYIVYRNQLDMNRIESINMNLKKGEKKSNRIEIKRSIDLYIIFIRQIECQRTHRYRSRSLRCRSSSN